MAGLCKGVTEPLDSFKDNYIIKLIIKHLFYPFSDFYPSFTSLFSHFKIGSVTVKFGNRWCTVMTYVSSSLIVTEIFTVVDQPTYS